MKLKNYDRPTFVEALSLGMRFCVQQDVDFDKLAPICHLRTSSHRWLYACPHDTKTFLECQHLHNCIHQNTMYSSHGYCDTFLFAIPGQIYDWYALHTFDEIVDMWVTAAGRLLAAEPENREFILRDTPPMLLERVQKRKIKAFRRQRLPKWLDFHSYAGDYKWFLQGHQINCVVWGLKARDTTPESLTSWMWERTMVGGTSAMEQDAAYKDYVKYTKLAGGEPLKFKTFNDHVERQKFPNQSGFYQGIEVRKSDLRDVKPLTHQADNLRRAESDADAFEFCRANQNGSCWVGKIDPKNPKGYVYLLHDGEFYKIGYSGSDPASRLAACQTGNARKLSLVGSIRGSIEKEAILHRYFANKRINGEWFALDENDVRKVLKA